MSETWKSAWVDTMIYWRDHWRRWLSVYLVSVAGFSAFLVMNPSLAPFIFTQIQPVNDAPVLKTYQQNVGALMGSAGAVIITGLVILALSTAILVPLLSRRGLKIKQSVLGIGSVSLVTVITMAVLAIASAPKGAPTISSLATSAGLIIGGMVVIIPAFFWLGPITQDGHGMTLAALVRHHLIDALVMAWAWTIGLVMSGMLAAGFGWAAPVSVGDISFAVMAVAETFVAFSATRRYLRTIRSEAQPHSVSVPFKRSLHS